MELLLTGKVEDILYTNNNKGPYKQSKVGEKYDYRKGRIYRIFLTNIGWLSMVEIDEDGNYTGYVITTTYFIKKYEVDDYVYLETENSIYKCIPIRNI